MMDSCISWAVFAVLGVVAALRFFFYCVELQEKDKEQDTTMKYDRDLIF